MRELFSVWSQTKQIVIIAVTASIYAGTLIPFKAIPIIPGLCELRPAAVIPVLFGIIFGPAAAWGSAIGNLIADFFGMLSPASLFGFAANFLYAYTAHFLWKTLVKEEVSMTGKQNGIFIFSALAASLVCAATVGTGVEVFKLAPFMIVFSIVLINNALMSGLLGPVLMRLLYPRIKKMGLVYSKNS